MTLGPDPASRRADAGPINAASIMKSGQKQGAEGGQRNQPVTSQRGIRLAPAPQVHRARSSAHRLPQP